MSNLKPAIPGQRVAAAPYDRSAVARAILANAAAQIAPNMLPVADFVPDRAVSLNQVSVAANTTSNALSLTFPTDGYTISVRATTEDGLAASMGGTLLGIQVDGRDNFWSSGAGNGPGYASFASISGANSTFGRYPIKREFLQANAWTVYIINTTSGTVVCDVIFDIVDTRNPPP